METNTLIKDPASQKWDNDIETNYGYQMVTVDPNPYQKGKWRTVYLVEDDDSFVVGEVPVEASPDDSRLGLVNWHKFMPDVDALEEWDAHYAAKRDDAEWKMAMRHVKFDR